jgi:cysteine desulfurase / selenocysteine lyase
MNPWRSQFPVLKRIVNAKPLVYLDSAATTLKPQCVLDAIADHDSQHTANVHRGVHTLSEEATAAYEGARCKVQSLLNARHVEEIIFTSGTTQSINLVAQSWGRKNLTEGDEILITHMEHHSNIVPWQMLCEERGCVLKVAPISQTGELIWSEFEKLVSSRTKLISFVLFSNALGTVNPLDRIMALAQSRNIPVLVDAAQAVAHVPLDVQAIGCDFLVFSGHKLYAPTGVGVLYGKCELLNAMPPVVGGGDMIRSVTFEKTTYAPLPYKFEAGTPNISGVVGLGAGIDFIKSIGFDVIAAHEVSLLKYGTDRLSALKGVRIIGTAAHKSGVLSFVVEGIHPHDLGTLLDGQGVAIRTGHHCAQPVMDFFKVPATARASLAIYNTEADIDALILSIQKAQELFL